MTKKVMGVIAAVLMLAVFVPDLSAQVDLLNEDFEGSWPPSGWTVLDGGGTVNGRPLWRRDDQWPARTNYTPGSGRCAHAEGYYRNGLGYGYFYDQDLVTPVIDATNYEFLAISYDLGYQQNGGNGIGAPTQEEGFVDVHSDGDWTNLVTYDSDMGGYSAGITEVYPIDFADGFDDVQIRFRYDSNNDYYYKHFYMVDNVRVYGYEGSGGELDLEMVNIVRPNPIEEASTAFTPECRVFNPTDGVVDAEIRFRVKNLDTQSTEYEDILHNYPLDPGYNAINAFRSFTPAGNTKYEALAVVEHPDDPNVDNNDVTKRFETEIGMQVSPIEILVPGAEQLNSFMPKANFAEQAGAESTDAVLHCRIEDGLEFSAVVYEDSTATPETFTALQEKEYEFAEATGLGDGTYTIYFWCTNPAGGDIISDPAELSLEFTYTGIVEEPTVERFGLTVSGNNVSFSLASATPVNLRVYDIAGNVVANLASGTYSAGTHDVSFDANPGVYFVKMFTPEFSATDKITVFK